MSIYASRELFNMPALLLVRSVKPCVPKSGKGLAKHISSLHQMAVKIFAVYMRDFSIGEKEACNTLKNQLENAIITCLSRNTDVAIWNNDSLHRLHQNLRQTSIFEKQWQA